MHHHFSCGSFYNKIHFNHSIPCFSVCNSDKSLLLRQQQENNETYIRHLLLKRIATDAIKHNKVFIIYGVCPILHNILLQDGWIEKIPHKKLETELEVLKSDTNIEKLEASQFLYGAYPNLIWNGKNNYSGKRRRYKEGTLYNRIKFSHMWATKKGLCKAHRNIQWHCIENIAELNHPRSYDSDRNGDREEFDYDFKVTACTSLLKWILYKYNNNEPVFRPSGKIPINIIVFALNRCKEYLHFKNNKDIDETNTPKITNGQWDTYLKSYYCLVANQDVFEEDNEHKLPMFLTYANFLLKEIVKYRPELNCEGFYNTWIIKPEHCSRGRGIRISSKLSILREFFDQGKYVFQKYIEEPLLIHDTKFDIRQFYLVTKTFPLEIWMYKDCYLKFSSQKYDLTNYHESIHLTNHAIQLRYTNCPNRHKELTEYNMWSLEKFKEYLKSQDKEGVWENIIYPGMRRAITQVMISTQETDLESKNEFELYGCDFLLDSSFEPWLIEINSNPDLNPSTPVTEKTCSALLKDMLKVLYDFPSNTNASTGQFECIYRQPYYQGNTKKTPNLYIEGRTLPNSFFIKGCHRTGKMNSRQCTEKPEDKNTASDKQEVTSPNINMKHFDIHCIPKQLINDRISNPEETPKSKVHEPERSRSNNASLLFAEALLLGSPIVDLLRRISEEDMKNSFNFVKDYLKSTKSNHRKPQKDKLQNRTSELDVLFDSSANITDENVLNDRIFEFVSKICDKNLQAGEKNLFFSTKKIGTNLMSENSNTNILNGFENSGCSKIEETLQEKTHKLLHFLMKRQQC